MLIELAINRENSKQIMFDSIKSVVLVILAAVPVMIGLIVGIINILKAIRKKELSLPELRLGVGLAGELPEEVPKKYRKQQPSFVAFVPKKPTSHPIVVPLFIRLEVPDHKEAIKNVRVMLEYKQQYLIDDELFESISQFEPTVFVSDDIPDKAYLIKSDLKAEELKKQREKREVSVYGGRAQVVYEFPIIRRGSTEIGVEFLLLPGFGSDDFEGVDEKPIGGFKHVLPHVRKIENLKDYFSVNVWVHAENHKKLNSRIDVLHFSNINEIEKDLTKFTTALWFGDSPEPGLYFTPWLYLYLLQKTNQTGRLSKEFFKNEMCFITFAELAKIKPLKKQSFSLLLPELSTNAIFNIASPNCDYYHLPEKVNNFESLKSWLAMDPTLIKSYKEKEKIEDKTLKESK